MNKTNLFKFLLPIMIFSSVTVIFISGCSKKETAGIQESNKQSSVQTDKNEAIQNSEHKNTPDHQQSEHIMINLPTMQCKICKKNIETAVKKLDGIEDINVVVKEKLAHINFDNSKTDLSKIENAITASGYDANDKKADQEAYKDLDDCCKLPKDRKE